MSITQRIIDWLGNEVTSTNVDATAYGPAQSCALMEMARHIAVDYVSAGIQRSEVKFIGPDGKPVLDDESRLWNVRPNPNQSHTEFMDKLVNAVYFRRDGALVVPVRTRGSTALYVADSFTVDRTPAIGSPWRFNNVAIEGKPYTHSCSTSTCYWFQLRADDRYRELESSLASLYSALAQSAEKAFKTKNGRKYKMRYDSLPGGNKKFQDEFGGMINANLQTFMTSDDVVYPEFQGTTLEEFASDQAKKSTDTSSDFISIRKDAYEAVAEGYHMPVSLLYGNVNNFDQVFTSFLTFAIDPVAQMIGDEISGKNFTTDDYTRGIRCKLDTSCIKHVDLFAVAQDADKLIADRVLNPNEVRRLTSQDRIAAPWADEYAMTKNLEPVGGGE